MNYRLLAKVMGLLVLLQAGALVACEAYGIFVERVLLERTHDYALLQAAGLALLLGGGLYLYGRRETGQILRKEAIAIVGLGWIVSTVVGAIPFVLCTPALSWAGAIFEAASGYTTTGSTVIADLDQFPRSILLWRSTMQWLGGMGILVLFVALLSTLGVGSKALFRHESSAQLGDGFHARIRQTALELWKIYLGLTVLCAAGLMIFGMTFYDAILHSFSTISTGGFSSRNASIAFYASPAVEVWLTLFMVLGGTSFVLMAWAIRRKFRRVGGDEEFRAYLWILGLSTLLITGNLVWQAEHGWIEGLRLAAFQVASIMTTTGFASADFGGWPLFAQALLVALMFLGGCTGSTAGAIKISRFLILGKAFRQQVVNAFRPNQVLSLKANGQVLASQTIVAALFFIALNFLLVMGGTVLVAACEPELNLLGSLTSVTATLFNVGPGLGAVGPAANFATISQPMLIFLSVLMLLGRLELFAILVLFQPALWRRY